MFKFIKEMLRPKTCVPDGCGFQQPNHLDEKCLICRLPMGEKKGNSND